MMAVRTAKTLSLLFQPLLTGLYLVLAAALLGAPSFQQGLAWAALVIFLAVVVPALDIARRVRLGRASDFQLALREERFRPLMIAIICAALALALVAAFSGPAPLVATMLTGLACGLVLTSITLVWKISFHSGALAAALVLAYWYGGSWALLLVPLLLAVAWSRIRLARHSIGQVVAGAGVAMLVSLLVLQTLYGG